MKHLSEEQEKFLDIMGRNKNWLSEALEDLRKQIFQETTKLEERLRRRSGIFGKEAESERMCKDGRYAKMEEGRERLAADHEVTRTSTRGSQTSEMEAELRSAEVKDRKEEIGLSTNHYLEDMARNSWDAKSGGRDREACCCKWSYSYSRKWISNS